MNSSSDTASFEDEMLAINPEYDIIFNKRDSIHRNVSPHALEPNVRWSSGQEMKIISKMNEILNAKPVGELAAHNDWDDQTSVETETITLMRKLGLEQSVDRAPDENRTIATVPVSDDVIIMKNGRKKMSIFMADTYFELKPRSEPSFDLDEDSTPEDESTASCLSEDLNQYQPILDSTFETETASTYLSEESMEKITPPTNLDSCKDETGERFNTKFNQSRKNLRTRNGSKHRPSAERESRLNKSKTSSSSSNSSWRNSNGSFSEMRDETNWRKVITKKPEKPTEKTKEEKLPVVVAKKDLDQNAANNCEGQLYKPKELYMKKKARLIQQTYF